VNGDPNNYSVKEILTQFVLPALNDLRTSQSAQNSANDARFKRLENFKSRAQGALALVTIVLLPIAVIVVPAAVGWR
jgi:hypothetical protein